MAIVNKHGLSRSVPPKVKREVRQRCGFGCVICGLAFYDYEHFDPDFSEATEHNPLGMTLLCSQCNQKRARGRLSVETVRAANASPRCLQQGFSSELLDFGPGAIEVKFAGVSFSDCRHLIVVNDRPILSVSAPIAAGQPLALSGVFTDSEGRVMLTIKENVWSVGAENWDVECVGPRITIRNGLGDISLILRMDPPTALVVERLDMQYQGMHLRGDADTLDIYVDGIFRSRFQGCSVRGGMVGVALQNGPIAANGPASLS